MGKKSSKLKQETIDSLTTDTYCKLLIICLQSYLSLKMLFDWMRFAVAAAVAAAAVATSIHT